MTPELLGVVHVSRSLDATRMSIGPATTGHFANGFTIEEHLVNMTLPHFTEETKKAQTNEIIQLLRNNRSDE